MDRQRERALRRREERQQRREHERFLRELVAHARAHGVPEVAEREVQADLRARLIDADVARELLGLVTLDIVMLS